MRHMLWMAVLAACSGEPKPSAPASVPATTAAAAVQPAARRINPRLLRRFPPLGSSMGAPAPAQLVNLGRQLFYDRRLSRDLDLSCNSCHRLDSYGVDGEVTSIGANGKRGRRNSPSVFHSAGQFAQFWDGRALTIETQATMPIFNPDEMAIASPEVLVARLRAIPDYLAAFEASFPGGDPVTVENVASALAAFERGLVTPSRWDRFLTGDETALTDREVEGFKVFSDLGCVVCHTGELIGGTSYQRAGAIEPWPNQTDPGRFEVTNSEADRMMFKVPSLRNVAKTAPYFHDGSSRTLDGAVRVMARHQLGVDLSDSETGAVVAWLGSLSGDIPSTYIKEPALP
ncbi:MAG: c-type cytochrome [Myxococcota bacterium]|nr:c-type cytochrome [Deltaproteobacteria bacterium]MDQ3334023.1 c-type cytochrome [Myxococcota bacterium]